MEGDLTPIAARAASRGALVFFLLVVASPSWAENLPDPTRPPDVIERAGADEMAMAGPVLQSTIVGAKRREAIISGQTVRVGDKYRNAEVVAINEGEVVLREGKERTVLTLFPGGIERPKTASSEKPRIDREPAKRGRQQK